MKRRHFFGSVALALTLVLCATWCGGAVAQGKAVPDTVPRIAIVGDSWGMFLWWFRSFKEALASGDFPGCENYTEIAYDTVVGGAKTFQFINAEQFPPAADIQQDIREMLRDYPTIDVVVISLGGNDVLYGTEYVLPEDLDKKIKFRCPGDPEDYNVTLLDKVINQDMSALIDLVLEQRPDIRILIPSYDYAGDKKRGDDCSLEIQHMGFVAMGVAKQRLAEEKGDRVHFINNYGLMQYTYGTYEYTQYDGSSPLIESAVEVHPAGYVKPGFEAASYLPTQLPDPDDLWSSPWTVGGSPALIPGFPQYHSPLDSLIDKDMHLDEDGYYVMAHRMVDEYIAEWLNYPKAFEINPLTDAKGEQYQFQVTFSEPVSGVDTTDFEVATFTLGAKLDISNAEVISVSPASGPSQVYTVTVDMNPGGKSKDGGIQDVVHIHVLDDDSIVDGDSNPLGGANTATWTDNGKFTYYGPFAFAEFNRPTPGNFSEAQHYLGVLTSPYRAHINYSVGFGEDLLDINNNDLMGLIMTLMGSGDIDVNTLYIPGNGVLESFEFALIDYCLKHPEVDFSNKTITWDTETLPGVSASAVQSLWTANLSQMQEDLGGAEDNLALEILGGLETVFAGYMTIGETQFCALLNFGTGFLANDDSVSTYLPGVEFHQVSLDDYEGHPEWFTPEADLDFDGFTNGEEYLYFQCEGKEAYAQAAFSPSLKPKALKSVYEAGESARMYVPEFTHPLTTYQWYKDGQPLTDDGVIVGATTRTLNILSLSEAHTGSYTCEWNDQNPNTKGTSTYGPVQLNVVSELPAAGGFGLLGLALVVGLVGAAPLARRRKK